MEKSNISQIVNKQSDFFKSNVTKPYAARVAVLKKLRDLIDVNEDKILKALYKDLGKSTFESYVAEVSFVIQEIDVVLKKLKGWMKPKRVSSPLLHFPASSWIQLEPLGKVLIIAPWNYPFQLLISPLVGALSAGNTCVLKPSELAPNVSKLIRELISENFDEEYIAVVEGAVEETTQLLDQRFDLIFYTGNETVGKIVMAKAAKYLTPVVLELGGKSPCIVLDDADLDIAAKRIVWGKFFNAGQTCVAPDYALVSKEKSNELEVKIVREIRNFYGKDVKQSSDYGKIVNERHWNRLMDLIDKDQLIHGGGSQRDSLYIEPTLIKADLNQSEHLKCMKQEIFGPILPIFEIDSLAEGIDFINSGEKPLAAYLFSKSNESQNTFLDQVSCGGVTLNDCIVHLSNDKLPFGGVGNSGMGAYHGDFSFKTFSHQKSVMKRYFFLDVPLKYPPYQKKFSLIKWLLKIIG